MQCSCWGGGWGCVVKCEAMFEHLLKLAHMNRARRFRRLAHVFVDFNAMQHEVLTPPQRGTLWAQSRME
eukprot:6148004-Amphidinium_carterae.1